MAGHNSSGHWYLASVLGLPVEKFSIFCTYDDRALYIFSSSSHDESSLSDEEIAQITRGRDINQVSADELIQLYKGFERRSGIYIRLQWGTAAVWGGLLPLFLIAASGFILLGRTPQRR
jgi:hypothetical protein